MIKEFLQPRKELSLGGGGGKEAAGKEETLRAMDRPELSLGPSLSTFTKSARSSSSDSDANSRRKRKHAWDEPMTQASIELQLNDPLPLDWEQCLDLQSGRMYYLNRRTLKKSWIRPKEQKLDLELNISTLSSSEWKASSTPPQESKKHNLHHQPNNNNNNNNNNNDNNYCSSSGGNMVAVVCINCHLLVMLCKSSPSCPNCKYTQSLPLPMQQVPRRIEAVKSLETLSLLH